MALTAISAELPTLYEYYTDGGIKSGLNAEKSYFTLNEKNITIYSGAMHYFRVPKEHWRDRLRKMRAAGLNAVETYIPWNLHEFMDGIYDFGDGGSEMQDFLDVRQYMQLAKEEDLFVIARPGPYICSEWEFGGMPSWLLRQEGIKVRTHDPIFMGFVARYFRALLAILSVFQFTQGGPIVAFQVENEYGNTGNIDKEYLMQLRKLFLDNGIVELLVTSDSAGVGTGGTLPEYFLMTANFARNPEDEFNRLKQSQPQGPTMAMEFWTGWYDHWLDEHNTRDNDEFKDVLERILNYPASFSMYMFEGGTSFGFLNGANTGGDDHFYPDTNNYDYDAPLTECGDYTGKYDMVKEVLAKHDQILTKLPEKPPLIPRKQYPSVAVNQQILLSEVIDNFEFMERLELNDTMTMEYLPINLNSGQSYGYLGYRKYLDIPAGAELKISGYVNDVVLVLLNGKLISKVVKSKEDLKEFGFWMTPDSTLILSETDLTNATLDLLLMNMGRGNFGGLDQFNQYKGLQPSTVTLNGKNLYEWLATPLEFKAIWTTKILKGWHEVQETKATPALYKATFEIEEVGDTFIDMQGWNMGLVIVNGFVLCRHFHLGPQQTCYLPGQFLVNGTNEIVIFEHYDAADSINFTTEPLWKTK